ncbi:hypothetical protein QBC45DRAFT_339876 [Copromyces sp. CBS 386.78]|nr:hypothetical protein QBC45DRAFT_339876 [Copromyces sp. CBS 386.78]
MRLTEQHDQLAPRPGYVYRFDSTIPHQRYYFVSELGYGVQSHAQLVQDRETGLKVVQKVDRKLCPSTLEREEPAEISILRRLISSHRLADYQPRWITLLNYEQVLAYQETERAGSHLSYQVSYWKFCNGGTLYSLVNPYIPDFIAEKDWLAQGQDSPAPQRHLPQLPISLVARAIRHICETLEVMYQGGSEAVYHCDLHASNIFLHWTKEDPLPDFYIGDFGMARTASQSLLDSEKFSHKCGMPFDKQPKEPSPPGIVPEGYRRRWDLAMFHECNLNNFFRFMVVSATPTIKDACPRSIRLPVSRPQPQRSRDVVKQIAQQMNQPTPKHRHRHKANAATAGPGLCNEQPSTSSRSWWGFGPNPEPAGDLEKEALQWEQHTRNFKEFVKEKKKKALFQEFETAPFVFRRDGPEAKEILRKALKLPQRHPYRVYHGGEVDEPESLEEVWGRENVAGPWRVVEVMV